MATPTSAEVLHDRLKAFLRFLKPVLLEANIDQDRLAQLRRLSDVRIRKFAISKPQITGIDLCGLLADPRSGRFDELADEAGLVKKGHLSIVLPLLAEDMGYLIEACLTLQVAGLAAMKGHAKAFVAKQGPVAATAGTASGQAAKPAVAPLPPAVAKLLAPIKDLWTLPPSNLKALSLLAAPDSPAEAVCAELERDPALAAQVLRMIKATTYSPSGNPSSVKAAVVGLGYPRMRRYVLASALRLKLAPPHPQAGFDERAYWLRSLLIAHAGIQVHKATKLGNPEEQFWAGLFHDVGRLAEAKAGGPAADAPSPQVGAEILGRWRFPAAAVESARHHRDSAEQLEEFQLPREAIVVTALHHLTTGTSSAVEITTWAGFLRVAADAVRSILDHAAKKAASDAAELFE